MRPLPLTPETQAVFARICTYDWTLRVFGMGQSQAWRLVEARVENRINAAGVAVQKRNQCRLPLKTDPFVPLKSDPPP